MNIRRLLWSMNQPQTFYVLGAGASYGIVPTTNEPITAIWREYKAGGTFGCSTAPWSDLHLRILGSPSRARIRTGDPMAALLLRHIPTGALDLFVQKALHRPSTSVIPSQYAVFDVVGWPATICNFNLDGLASRYCSRRHTVLEPHGHIDTHWFEGRDYTQWRDATVTFDITLPHVTPKLLLSPEPPDLLRHPAFAAASRLFPSARAIAIIGYSFGSRNGRLDDSAAWHFFIELLRIHPKPVFVLSPEPEELTDILRQSLSSDRVTGVPIYWEAFSECLFAAASPALRFPHNWHDERLRRLMNCYSRVAEHRCDRTA